MATDTTQSGLFMTPEMYQQAQQQAALSRGIELAQLDPLAAAKAQLYAGGYQAAGALGGQDPVLQRQSARRALIQQIDMSNPESLVKGIQASTQDPELSAYLLGKYKELTGIQKDQSVITKNANWQKAETDKGHVRSLLSDIETRLSNNEPVSQRELNEAKLAYSEKGQAITRFDPSTQTVLTIPGIDMSIFPNITKAFGKPVPGAAGSAGAPVAATLTPAGQEAAANKSKALEEGATQLNDLLTRITDTEKLVSPWSTGWGAKIFDTMPNTTALTLKDNTETIKGNIAITKLQELKDKSKTGASGLGQLSDRDMATVKGLMGNLNPMSANYANDLKTIREFFVRAQKAMKDEARLTQEKAGTSSTGNADMAPKPSAMSGKNPQLQPARQFTFEEIMQSTSADPKNKGRSKQEIEAAVRDWMTKNPDKVKP